MYAGEPQIVSRRRGAAGARARARVRRRRRPRRSPPPPPSPYSETVPVGEARVAARVDEHVGRLEVAEDDVVQVQVAEREHDLGAEEARGALGEARAAARPAGSRACRRPRT